MPPKHVGTPLCPQFFSGALTVPAKSFSLSPLYAFPPSFHPAVISFPVYSSQHRPPSLLNPLCLFHSSVPTSLPFPAEASSTFLAPAHVPVHSAARAPSPESKANSSVLGDGREAVNTSIALSLPHYVWFKCFSSQEGYMAVCSVFLDINHPEEIIS